MVFLNKKENYQLKDELTFFGSKRISILVILLDMLSNNEAEIVNFSKDPDVINLLDILKILNIKFDKSGNKLTIYGQKINRIKEPEFVVSIKNSRDILYLLIAILSNCDGKFFFSSDNININREDLSELFKLLGDKVKITARNNINLPLLLENHEDSEVNGYVLSSTSFKYVGLFQSLLNKEKTTIIDKETTEDYLERLMVFYNVDIMEKFFENNIFLKKETIKGKEITVLDNTKFISKNVVVPSDLEDVVYFIFLALCSPDSDIILKNVAINEYSDPLIKILIEAGADITLLNQKISYNLKVSDIRIRYSKLKDIHISGNNFRKIENFYQVLIFLSIINKTSIEIQGIRYLKEANLKDYELILKFLTELNVNFSENKNGFVVSDDFVLNNKDIILSDLENINSNTLSSILFFSLFMEQSVKLNLDDNDIKNKLFILRYICNLLNIEVLN